MTRPFFTRDRVTHFDIFDKHAEEAIEKMKVRLKEGYSVDFQVHVVIRFRTLLIIELIGRRLPVHARLGDRVSFRLLCSFAHPTPHIPVSPSFQLQYICPKGISCGGVCVRLP
jgi:hypothetical protein